MTCDAELLSPRRTSVVAGEASLVINEVIGEGAAARYVYIAVYIALVRSPCFAV
jgi:hypothetical protein